MLATRGPGPLLACAGDTIIASQGHEQFTPLLLQHGELFHCKIGKFHHSDLIGKPLGSYVSGMSNRRDDAGPPPRLLLLPLTATLWTQTVPHRTQILYDTDIAVICLQMRLRPGRRVVEAGTGSGSLTHSLAKVVSPHGTVFTCDFHKGRCLDAAKEFAAHGFEEGRRPGTTAASTAEKEGRRPDDGHCLVSSHWRDVCTTNADVDVEWEEEEEAEDPADLPPSPATRDAERRGRLTRLIRRDVVEQQEAPRPGFGLPAQSVDAVFLDVPAPWQAVENVRHVLKPGGILATFSPCIEQTQRLCSALREPPYDFVDIRTVEALSKYFEPGPPASVFPNPSGATWKRPRESETPAANGSVDARKATADEEETQNPAVCAASAEAPSRSSGAIRLRACAVSKGHSAYLTFARRRLPLDKDLVDED